MPLCQNLQSSLSAVHLEAFYLQPSQYMQHVSDIMKRNFAHYTTADYKHILVITFNVCQRTPQSSFYEIVCKQYENYCSDIIIFVFQELDKLLIGSTESCFKHWCQYLRDKLVDYVQQVNEKIAGVGVLIFVKSSLNRIQIQQKRLTRGCKGYIAVSFDINATRVLFIGCHLSHGQSKCHIRDSQFWDMWESIQFKTNTTISLKTNLPNEVPSILHAWDHDVAIVAGDLNYRLSANILAPGAQLTPQQINYDAVGHCDQLTQQMKGRKVFLGFQEGRISFGPTYKYQQLDIFDLSRTPSWCDRVLFSRAPHLCKAELRNAEFQQVNNLDDNLELRSQNSSMEVSNSTTSIPLLIQSDEGIKQIIDRGQYETIQLNKDTNQISITSSDHDFEAHSNIEMKTNKIECISYTSFNQIITSDHKPVTALLNIRSDKIDKHLWGEQLDKTLKIVNHSLSSTQPTLTVSTKILDFDRINVFEAKMSFFHAKFEFPDEQAVKLNNIKFYLDNKIKKYITIAESGSQIQNHTTHINKTFTLQIQPKFIKDTKIHYMNENNGNFQFKVVVQYNYKVYGIQQSIYATFDMRFQLVNSPIGVYFEELLLYDDNSLNINTIKQDNTTLYTLEFINLPNYDLQNIMQIPKSINKFCNFLIQNINDETVFQQRDAVCLQMILSNLYFPLVNRDQAEQLLKVNNQKVWNSVMMQIPEYQQAITIFLLNTFNQYYTLYTGHKNKQNRNHQNVNHKILEIVKYFSLCLFQSADQIFQSVLESFGRAENKLKKDVLKYSDRKFTQV